MCPSGQSNWQDLIRLVTLEGKRDCINPWPLWIYASFSFAFIPYTQSTKGGHPGEKKNICHPSPWYVAYAVKETVTVYVSDNNRFFLNHSQAIL